MSGNQVKETLNRKGINLSSLARILNITPQNLNNMLNRDDIRTGLLEDISKASGISIAEFFGDKYLASYDARNTDLSEAEAYLINIRKEIDETRKQTEAMHQQAIASLEEINEIKAKFLQAMRTFEEPINNK